MKQQPMPIGKHLVLQDLLRVGALLAHRGTHQAGNPHTRGSRSGIHNALFGDLLPGDPNGTEDPGQRDRGRSLDVVIETGEPLAIAIQDRERDVLVEILPLQQARGKTRFTPSTKASINSS